MSPKPPTEVTPPEPVVDIAIEAKTGADLEKLGVALTRLAAEDPNFRVKTDEESGQTIISGTSELHLDAIVDRLRGEFGVGANVGAPQVAYREAITRAVEHEYIHRPPSGSGLFIRIKFRIEPGGPDSDYEFVCQGPATLLPQACVADIRRSVEAVLGSGPLIGFPIVNVRFVLIDASGDDTSSPALEKAARAGLREAVQKAAPKILEPVMSVEVTTPGNYVGDIIGDLKSRRGHIRSTADRGLTSTLRAIVPLSNMFGYVNSLRTLSNGRAGYTMTFDHYEPVPPVHPQNGPYGGALAMRA